MWRLKNIQAQNICAFHELSYDIKQGCATLIFGNNMDDDSQNSNGSGKSALIETIAISITGEALRKVNMDEIINDEFDEAEITACFENQADNSEMNIHRIISRKKPQSITITMSAGNDSQIVEEASVAEYNRYILDTLGVTKDSIFSNYILTAKKYRSFLSCPDKEKKDLINRFSNGILVDQSIEALGVDLEASEKEYNEVELDKANYEGRIAALEEEIKHESEEAVNRSANKAERIKEWKESIKNKRWEIRDTTTLIDVDKNKLDELDRLDLAMQKLEGSNTDLAKSYEKIFSSLEEARQTGIEAITDYKSNSSELQGKLHKNLKTIESLDENKKIVSKKLEKIQKEYDKLLASSEKNTEKLNDDKRKVDEKIKGLGAEIKEIEAHISELEKQKKKIIVEISQLETSLAGVIQCPKCHHEFVLKQNVDIKSTRQTIKDHEKTRDSLIKEIDKGHKDYDKCVETGKKTREKQNDIIASLNEIDDKKDECASNLKDVKRELSSIEDNLQDIKNENVSIQTRISNLRTMMFDELFEHIDYTINSIESEIQQLELKIENAQGSIQSYEESIKEAEKATETDVIGNLKESKKKYEAKLSDILDEETEKFNKLQELRNQEKIFVEFKTYLANAKIEAISDITNNFLEAIGSDIRVKFSGYTLLKSGKIREKISISLLRDGVDCGSFDKFSRGEQTRVELACILAMHELMNENCEDGKGLDLLVIDEILDATDEQGLTNVFKALNETKVTSLVVSHGNIAENYPNRLIVNKQNGISFI